MERPKYTYAPKPAIDRARSLRTTQTDAEARLWYRLRSNSFGAKFRRQHPIGPYTLDFYCHAAKLAVEVDGGQHFEEDGMSKDAARTRFLNAQGLLVLRFSNREVLLETVAVLEAILREVERRLPSK